MTIIEFSLPKYLEFLDEWAAVKDVESLPGNQNHAAENKGRRPLRSDSSRYSSAALRASLANGEINESKGIYVLSGMNNHKTSQCGKAKQLSLKKKLGKVFNARDLRMNFT